MRIAILFLILSLPSVLGAQVFHVDDSSAVLIKNTSQSPAHWYIEVISDLSVDTTLRWKTHFENIPNQWGISFDDGDNYHTIIADNDSADFTLFTGLDFPQKLIIGATLNGTPGHGVVFMDLYNPLTPSSVQHISYEFIVTLLGLDELNHVSFLTVQNNAIFITNGEFTRFKAWDQQGKIFAEKETNQFFDLKELPSGAVYFLEISQNDRHLLLHLMR